MNEMKREVGEFLAFISTKTQPTAAVVSIYILMSLKTLFHKSTRCNRSIT